MKPVLSILTTHFGTNYSGGSLVTAEIFSRLQDRFDRINVIGTELGDHSIENLKFHRFRSWGDSRRLIQSIRNDSTHFYGDFYNSIVLAQEQVPFYFTYHDNWPELGSSSVVDSFRATFYERFYEPIFEKAQAVVSVSAFKQNYIKKFTSRTVLIRNGYTRATDVEVGRGGFLMVGNIDSRKYELALPLFEKLDNPGFHIDIHGKVIDQKVADQLNKFRFVNLLGFQKEIHYQKYRALIHASKMENLPIVFCESLDTKTPVITFDVGGISEVVNSKNGTLIAPYDIDSMSQAIQSIGQKIFEFDANALSHFDWDKASQAYASLLKLA